MGKHFLSLCLCPSRAFPVSVASGLACPLRCCHSAPRTFGHFRRAASPATGVLYPPPSRGLHHPRISPSLDVLSLPPPRGVPVVACPPCCLPNLSLVACLSCHLPNLLLPIASPSPAHRSSFRCLAFVVRVRFLRSLSFPFRPSAARDRFLCLAVVPCLLRSSSSPLLSSSSDSGAVVAPRSALRLVVVVVVLAALHLVLVLGLVSFCCGVVAVFLHCTAFRRCGLQPPTPTVGLLCVVLAVVLLVVLVVMMASASVSVYCCGGSVGLCRSWRRLRLRRVAASPYVSQWVLVPGSLPVLLSALPS